MHDLALARHTSTSKPPIQDRYPISPTGGKFKAAINGAFRESSVTAEESLFRWPGSGEGSGRYESRGPRRRTDEASHTTEIRGARRSTDTVDIESTPCADTTFEAAQSSPSPIDRPPSSSHTTYFDITPKEERNHHQPIMESTVESPETGQAPPRAHLLSLPSEIIHQIIQYLPEMSLYAASLTCQTLQTHSFTDSLWQNLLDWPDLPSPHPYLTYRALHHALSPHLYLKRKVFIGDRQYFGSILVSKYMPLTGTLEAFSLTTTPGILPEFTWWSWDTMVPIYPYDITIGIRDEPELKITPNCKASVTKEIPIRRGGIFMSYLRAAAILKKDVYPQMAVWPPRTIPAETRVRNESATGFRSDAGAAGSFVRLPSDISISGTVFIRKGGGGFNDLVGAAVDRSAFMATPMTPQEVKDPNAKWRVDDVRSKSGFPSTSAFRIRKWAVLGDLDGDLDGRPRMGESVETFAELDEALWTPTKEYPYRGIWVGNYQPHASEFLLFHQPETTGGRKRLEVIKLTGDPNIPRGEYTWIIDDLSSPLRTADENEHEWPGAKVYMARGHIAEHEFQNDEFVDIQVILPDPQRDWQDDMEQKRKKPETGIAAGAEAEGETEDVGDGRGVGSGEERGSANAGSSRRRKPRIRYLDEPWVPRRAAVHWSTLQGYIKPFRRVDIDEFLDGDEDQ
ncbi:hypothetical protein TWF696_007330 [Orbilia brochopaga]|uniref:F-box domain-containing protein n=1 Tax=Orbilia brochopaga TaxID=3140254 RepID=A0AAV9URM9_9PEZI